MSAWIWLQTNHFEQQGTSLTASVAIIPWVGRSFTGFIVGFWHDRTLHRFASYTGARIEQLVVTEESIHWVVRDARLRLEMEATRPGGGLLQAPTTQNMGRRIAETLDATVRVELTSLGPQGRRRIFSGEGRHGGLEAVGDLERLRRLWRSE